MKYEVYLEDNLSVLIEKDAVDRSMTATQYIPELLAKLYKDKLGETTMADYSAILERLKLEIIKFVNSSQLDGKQDFVLRDVPYYRDLEDSIRVRLARSINKLICNPSTDTSLSSVIERSYRKDGTPKLRYGAAVYTKKQEAEK